jgi:large-conductance mechanosensitive channel
MTELSDKLRDYSKKSLEYIDKTALKTVTIGMSTANDFNNFILGKDILDLAVGVTIGSLLLTFSNNLIEIVGTPIINKMIGKSKLGERYKYIIFGMEFDIGRLIELIIKLLFTLFLIFLIFKYLPKMVSTKITKQF